MAASKLKIEHLQNELETVYQGNKSKIDIKQNEYVPCSYSEKGNSLNIAELLNDIEIEFNGDQEYQRIMVLCKKLKTLISNKSENYKKVYLLEELEDLYYNIYNLPTRNKELESSTSAKTMEADAIKDVNDIRESLQHLQYLLSTNIFPNIEATLHISGIKPNKVFPDHVTNLEQLVFLLWKIICKNNKEACEKCGINQDLLKTHILELQKNINFTERNAYESDNLCYSLDYLKLEELLKNTIKIPYMKELTNEIKLLQDEIMRLEKRNIALSDTLNLLQNEIHNLEYLNASISDQNSLQYQIHEQGDIIEKLHKENTFLRDKINNLNKGIELAGKFLMEQAYSQNEQATTDASCNEIGCEFLNVQLITFVNLLKNRSTQQDTINANLTGLKNLLQHKIIQQERIISNLIKNNNDLQNRILQYM